MSDNQRRTICRLLFLLTCALPTAVCGYWIGHPQTASGWERAIKAEMGVEAEIGFIATPSPFKTILHDVRFSDPEYGSLLETVAIEVTMGDQVQVKIPHPVNHVNNRGLARLIKTINQYPIRRASIKKEWRISFDEPIEISRVAAAELFGAGALKNQIDTNALLDPLVESIVIDQLRIDVEPSFDGTLVAAHFALPQDKALAAANQSTKKVEIQLKKERRGQAIWLHTFKQPLPCWLTAEFTEDIATGLGADATFAGELKLTTLSGQSPEVMLNGQFDRLSSPSIGFNAPNLSVVLDRCTFAEGQFSDWSAALRIPDGQRYRHLAIDPASLYTSSRRFVVGNAIRSAIANGLSPQMAAEPNSTGTLR
jgi:hypothetical protein